MTRHRSALGSLATWAVPWLAVPLLAVPLLAVLLLAVLLLAVLSSTTEVWGRLEQIPVRRTQPGARRRCSH